MRTRQHWGRQLLVLAALFGALGPLGAQERDGSLQLRELLDAVEERNPRLQAMDAAAAAAEYRQSDAGALPDPMLQLGIMNFGVPDLNADMAMSMAPSVQLSQRVPFPGKLSLRGEIAGFGSDMARAGAEEARWSVRGAASALFFDLYAVDRRLEVMQETLALLEDFQQIAKALYASGSSPQADVLRADVEVARMDGEIRRMTATRTTLAARLNALMDRPGDAPVATPSLGSLPGTVPARDTLLGWALDSRPVLQRGRLSVAQAGKRRELARRDIWPDFTVGLSYGQRDRGMGTERMASAMVGFSLPIHAGSRQYALRDEAAAHERLAQAELGSLEADVGGRITEFLAELDRARTLTQLYRAEVIPQARANVTSALSSYRVGTVDFMTLVDAQMTVNRYEGELYQLLGEYGKAVAALESTIGRVLPRDGSFITEER